MSTIHCLNSRFSVNEDQRLHDALTLCPGLAGGNCCRASLATLLLLSQGRCQFKGVEEFAVEERERVCMRAGHRLRDISSPSSRSTASLSDSPLACRVFRYSKAVMIAVNGVITIFNIGRAVMSLTC